MDPLTSIRQLNNQYQRELNTHYVNRIWLTATLDQQPANKIVLERLEGGICALERVVRDLEHILPTEDN